MGMRGRRGWNKMEECLGVNGRQLFVPVDCNLEEWEHALLVQCFYCVIRFMADRVISVMGQWSCLAFDNYWNVAMRCIVVRGRSSARISSLCDYFRSPEMEISPLKTVCGYPCSGVINKTNGHSCFVLAFCHVDIDVFIYSACAFLIVKWILMLIMYSTASL